VTRQETLDLQYDLDRLGYYSGPIDGIYGPLTKRAYDAYIAERHLQISVPILTPEPAKPWWASSAILGALVTILGAAASIAGWEFDAESAKELLPAAITLAGGIMAWVGTIRRKSPIDPTLVARVGTHDIRLPSRVRREPVPSGDRPEYIDHRGHFGD
jgi:peptidoglycan hydrolase-like protein with peptidoglycan-binding domain